MTPPPIVRGFARRLVSAGTLRNGRPAAVSWCSIPLTERDSAVLTRFAVQRVFADCRLCGILTMALPRPAPRCPCFDEKPCPPRAI